MSARIAKTTTFCGLFLLLCWMGMQIVHEFGHVAGGLMTGGRVAAVVLDPLTISRSDFAVNPQPHITVWCGPVLGVLLPLLFWGLCVSGTTAGRPPWAQKKVGRMAAFFSGFCLVGNGGYLLFGGLDGVGDCGVMRQCGTPLWLIMGAGSIGMVAGFGVWHRLGSLKGLLQEDAVSWRDVLCAGSGLLLIAGSCRWWFPQV
ncbi:MAG: hypothetical protein NXI04_27360 [Planctomycetaceae bacterium]|nr:hypothetical protein [Planctomycetaceae bacterium]